MVARIIKVAGVTFSPRKNVRTLFENPDANLIALRQVPLYFEGGGGDPDAVEIIFKNPKQYGLTEDGRVGYVPRYYNKPIADYLREGGYIPILKVFPVGGGVQKNEGFRLAIELPRGIAEQLPPETVNQMFLSQLSAPEEEKEIGAWIAREELGVGMDEDMVELLSRSAAINDRRREKIVRMSMLATELTTQLDYLMEHINEAGISLVLDLLDMDPYIYYELARIRAQLRKVSGRSGIEPERQALNRLQHRV